MNTTLVIGLILLTVAVVAVLVRRSRSSSRRRRYIGASANQASEDHWFDDLLDTFSAVDIDDD